MREAGVTERMLVMGALSPAEVAIASGCGAELAVWSDGFVDRLASLTEVAVHLHIDVDMGTVGERNPDQAVVLARKLDAAGLRLMGVMAQFAAADDLTDTSLDDRVSRFPDAVRAVRRIVPNAIAHAANSPVLLRADSEQFDMVRVGDLIYGFDPFGEDPSRHGLEPALALRSYVASTCALRAGETAGYDGPVRRSSRHPHRHRAVRVRRRVAPVHDRRPGDRRRSPLRGRRCHRDGQRDCRRGGRSVGQRRRTGHLIGAEGAERVTAEELGRCMGAVNAEVTCGITPRVRRVYHREGEPAGDALSR